MGTGGRQAMDNSTMKENIYKKRLFNLGQTPTSSEGAVRNALALISCCKHFVTSEIVEKSEEQEGENPKFNFLPKVTIPKRIKGDSLVKQKKQSENGFCPC